jgi:hypothetical protein
MSVIWWLGKIVIFISILSYRASRVIGFERGIGYAIDPYSCRAIMPQRPAPFYRTDLGVAYRGDALAVLRQLESDSVDLVVTSPPYALLTKKAYGNPSPDAYAAWFLPVAREIHRILRPEGSFVLNLGGAWTPGTPTRSLYHYRLVLAMVDEVGFHLAQECYWYNPAKMPAPAQWVCVDRVRVKDSVEPVWWLSKGVRPKADNRQVLRPYGPAMVKLIERGQKPGRRPSGHRVRAGWSRGVQGGSIPPNLLGLGDGWTDGFGSPGGPSSFSGAGEDAGTPGGNLLIAGQGGGHDAYVQACRAAGMPVHPARFPPLLPRFFVLLCTDPGDVVLDPFAGSNTTGAVAEALGRRWIAVESRMDYLRASRIRWTGRG